MAVLEKRAGLQINDCDAYVNITGGLKINEPALDLGIIMAVVSSYKNRAVDSEMVVFGEVGLSGEIRSVSNIEQRIAECEKLGFTSCILPQSALVSITGKTKMKLIGVSNISEAIGFI